MLTDCFFTLVAGSLETVNKVVFVAEADAPTQIINSKEFDDEDDEQE